MPSTPKFCTPVLGREGASNTLELRTAALTACLCLASVGAVVPVVVVAGVAADAVVVFDAAVLAALLSASTSSHAAQFHLSYFDVFVISGHWVMSI